VISPRSDWRQEHECEDCISRCHPVAFMRHVGPTTKWANLGQAAPLLGKEGWLGGDSLFIGVCHDDPRLRRRTRSATMRA